VVAKDARFMTLALNITTSSAKKDEMKYAIVQSSAHDEQHVCRSFCV
jgi:hypothetical protein